MRLRKITLMMMIIIATIMVASIFNVSFAATEKELSIKEKRFSATSEGYGYKVQEKIIHKIYNVNSNDDYTYYCMRGGPGFGSSTSMGTGSITSRTYSVPFDMKNPSSITGEYANHIPTPNSSKYKSLLWLLDNLYVAPKETSPTDKEIEAAHEYRDILLEAAGVESIKDEIAPNGNFDDNTEEARELDSWIDAIQQLAVWHFTNSSGDGYYLDADDTFEMMQNNENLSDIYDWDEVDNFNYGLFSYLVETAEKNNNYTPTTASTPYELDKTLKQTKTEVNNNYVIGPFKINKLSDTTASLEVTFKNGNTTIEPTIQDANGDKIESLKDAIGEEFYIVIPKTTNIEKITVEISGSYFNTTITYWSVSENNNDLSKEQPIVEIEREKEEYSDSVEYTPAPEERFDLALRKFITSINGVAPSTSREPQISSDTLQDLADGKTTTAVKVHPKTPLEVKTGDKVIYTIRVYNEGNVDGYVKEITDYLPEGLILAANSTTNTENGWTNPSGDGKTIVTDKLAGTLLEAFNGSELKYLDVQIECEVTASTEIGNVSLKNIAEITAHSDTAGDVTIKDDDSTPDNVDKNNYGTTSQEDDDDFEDLVIIGKRFDLALRKFITQINGVAPSTSREPQISSDALQDLADGKTTTAVKVHPKNALIVKTGDKVIYTIRVYNEGEVDGYVKQVTDYLPEGLKLADNSTINTANGWTNPSGDGKTIVTDKLAGTLLKAFDGSNLQYLDVQVECEVIATVQSTDTVLKNIAEITAHSDTAGDITVKDDDSTPGNVDKSNYGTTSQEDDDDFEQLVIIGQYFDLALRKFITAVGGELQYSNGVIGNIEIPKTNINYPIYEEANITNLESGICLSYGELNKAGENAVLIGHNYRNGTLFSNNKNLSIGDKIYITDSTGQKIAYKIYDIQELETSDDDYITRNTNGKREISLSSPTDDNKKRLVILGVEDYIVTNSTANNSTTQTAYNREPVVDVSPLKNGQTTATYKHNKTPVNVDVGDIVTYTIRVYNEGQVDGYVDEITDHLPEWLEFVNDDFNASYGWKVSSDGRTVTTDITSPNTQYSASRDTIYANRTQDDDKVLLKAFDLTGTELDYIDVKIKCKVKDTGLAEKITNIAEITQSSDTTGSNLKDRDNDSLVTLPTDATLPNYKDDEINRGDEYIPGQEDDDDFEKVIVQKFDLSLRKYITGVNGQEITNRVPVFSMDSNGKMTYTHTKTPVEVANGDIVIYTLRIYNEGNQAGYAEEVKDDLPEGLEYLPDYELNKTYRWKMYKEDGTETTNVSEAKVIKTDYLSKDQETESGRDNLIEAFNKDTMTMPDYKDVKIAFKVTEPNTSDRILINTAEISNDSDEKGDSVEDIDSTPDNDQDGEDDIDIEKVKVKYFDLALEKIITEYSFKKDGKTTITKTGHKFGVQPEPIVKVELLNEHSIETAVIKFKYQIKVTNEGEIAGYAEEIKDYIPEGLKFAPEDNPKWKLSDDGKTVTTDQLKDKLLEPGESAVVEITLRWINGEKNLGLKQNWAEISKDNNDSDSPDIDSTPDNRKEGEDDIDDASVILSIVTGIGENYIVIVGGVLAILSAGIVLIKKFVI